MLYYLKRAVASAINDRNVGTFVDYRSSPFIWQNVYRPLHVTIRRKCEANGISTPQACRVHCGKTQPLACAIFPKLGRYLTWQATHSPEAAEQKI
jgi:hypothetical protein